MIFTDQMKRKCVLDHVPERIVSLVPSQSELLYDLGLKKRIAGCTKFCIHPRELHEQCPKIGGTKQLNIEKIRALRPDLIIGNKEENIREQIEELEKEFPVWMSDVNNYEEALQMIGMIGDLCDVKPQALSLIRDIETAFEQLKNIPESEDKTTVYLIWKDPFMAAGKHTFIDSMIKKAGFVNLIKESRYPELSIDSLKNTAARYVWLSSEPYPFSEQHVRQLQECLPQSRICLVDGEMFSWYGSRMKQAASYFISLHQLP